MNKHNKHSSGKASGNLYDRIFKENAEYLFIPLIEKELNIRIQSYKPLQEKITRTSEREMDFFYHILTKEEKQFLLHLEFQTEDDKEMIYRMGEYHGLSLRKYKMPIRHVVVFLGKGTPKMKTRLNDNEIFYGFNLINIHGLDTSQFLSSQVPEVILLALLSNFKKERTEAILRLLVKQLKTACKSKKELDKYLAQLIILSRLRKLEHITSKIIQDMPINYDIEQDWLYNQGMEKGIARGIKKGIMKGMEKMEQKMETDKKESIEKLLDMGIMSITQIANVMKVSTEYVKQIKSNMKI